MTDLSLFRIYEAGELGPDGYPVAWHVCQAPDCDRGLKLAWDGSGAPDVLDCVRCDGTGKGLKHLVRAEAHHRCVRCLHPYVVGAYDRVDRPGGRAWPAEEERLVEDPALQRALLTFPDVGATRRPKVPKTNWSPCDRRCVHGGPIRHSRTVDGDPDDVILMHHVVGDEMRSGPLLRAGDLVRAGVPRVEAAWRILTVHHLNGRKHDCRWHNLVSLCQRCHLLIQRKVTMEQVYPGEHSDWFKPYAAGFYAASYLGRELTRAEAEEQMDDLLSLERMA